MCAPASKRLILMTSKRPSSLKGHAVTCLLPHCVVHTWRVPGLVLDYKVAELHVDLFIKFWNPAGLLEFVKSKTVFLGEGCRWADSDYKLVSEGGV